MTVTLRSLVDALRADQDYFGPEGAVPATFEDGANNRLLLITGGNASGKSFACKWLNSRAMRDGIEFMHVGMGKRTESGIVKAMMFGDENYESTGHVSAKVIGTGHRTCQSRAKPHVLCHDEPDIGMSDEMQDAAGQVIANFCADLPAHTLGVIVVTHSRAIASRLMVADELADGRRQRRGGREHRGPGAAGVRWDRQHRVALA